VRPRTLLILLLVVAGLVAFIWLYERELPSSDERAVQAKLLFHFDEEDVTGLEIEWEGKRVLLERQGQEETAEETTQAARGRADGEWRLAEPLAARADDSLVASLLGSLTSMEKERTLADMNAAEAGLEEPRARVRVHLGDEVRELLIGSEVPASNTMIVGVAETDGFFVVADGIWSQLTREPGEWRDRDVFAGRRADVERISLTAGGQRLLLARRGDDFWLESPLVDRADEEKVAKLIGDITSLRVEAFVDEPEQTVEEMGFDPPRAVLEVVLKEQIDPFRMELGAAVPDHEGRVLARVDGQLIELDTELARVMEESSADWLSTAWSSLETFQIDEVVIVDETGTMTLERAGAIWKRGDDEIPFTTASDLLYAITETTADRILSPAEVETLGVDWESPLLELRLAGDEESGQDELSLFETDDGDFLARSADRKSVLVLPAEAIEEIRRKIDEARSVEGVPEATEPEGEETELEPGP